VQALEQQAAEHFHARRGIERRERQEFSFGSARSYECELRDVLRLVVWCQA
jgi:hypothetical protein